MSRPESSSRWAAVLGILWPAKVLAAFPAVALVLLLSIVQGLVAEYGFWAALCAGRYPETARQLLLDVLRLQGELLAWVFSFSDAYPPLGLSAATGGLALQGAERGDPAVRHALWPFPGGARRGTGVNRWWAVLGALKLRSVAALPHLLIVIGLGVAAFVLGWIGYWIILFGGRYPHGLWWFDSGVLRWAMRLEAFVLGLTDRYPSWSLA